MRKIISILLMSVIMLVGMAQNRKDIQQSKKNASDKVIKLVETLFVYPEDVGYTTGQEAGVICEKINAQKMYGYNDWRIPTEEELSMIYRNQDKVSGLVKGCYLTRAGVFNEWATLIGYRVFDMETGNCKWRRADGNFEDYMPLKEKANIRLIRGGL
jgi:glucose dehydrogenase